MAHDLLGHAADQEVRETRAPGGRHHDGIGPSSGLQNAPGRVPDLHGDGEGGALRPQGACDEPLEASPLLGDEARWWRELLGAEPERQVGRDVEGHDDVQDRQAPPMGAGEGGRQAKRSGRRSRKIVRHEDTTEEGRHGADQTWLGPWLQAEGVGARQPEQPGLRDRVPGHRHTVLVVEDDADTREALAVYLRGEGCLVVEAADGEEALSWLSRGIDPCLVLLDLRMPGVDGWRFRAIQRDHPGVAGIPVAVISGAEEVPDVGPDRFAQAFLRKPIDLERLRCVLYECCPQGPRRPCARW